MAGTKGIIEIIVVVAVIGAAWMYRGQIMSFLKGHGLSLPSGNGGPTDEERISLINECKSACAGGDSRADECLSCLQVKTSLARAYFGYSHYGRVAV